MRQNELHGYEDAVSDSEDESITYLSGGSYGGHGANKRPVRYGYSIMPLDEAGRKPSGGVGERSVKYKQRKKCRYNGDSDDDYDDGGGGGYGVVLKENEVVRPTVKKSVTKRKGSTAKAAAKRSLRKYEHSIDYNVVFVVDYDMTLVDRHARPFPAVKAFLRDLYEFDGGRSTLVLYSHASSGHIEHGLETYFADEAHYFSEIIADPSMLKNKPVTRVRRALSDMKYLCGPFCIIDDVRANLDDDQYDITVDVSRHFVRDKTTNGVAGVDYKAILCLLRQGVKQWLATKIGGGGGRRNTCRKTTTSGDDD